MPYYPPNEEGIHGLLSLNYFSGESSVLKATPITPQPATLANRRRGAGQAYIRTRALGS